MSVPSWGSRWTHFIISHRVFVFLVLLGICLAGLWQARSVSLSAKMTDYYPRSHPHVQLYREFAEMLKLANTVVVTVTVKDGTIYTNETLGKIHRLTVDLLETRGANPSEVLSLTHPRLKNIRVSSENIEILPVVDQPEQQQSPEALTQIKKAVYTNLGIRGIYVSPDDKTALIRAGFWDDLVDPPAIFTRLQAIAERERDANTEVHVTGNLVLAAWLREAASRILLLLFTSGIIVLALCTQGLGIGHAFFLALMANVLGASIGFSLLGIYGLTLEPLMLFVFLPLGVRGVTLVISWYKTFVSVYRSIGAPFAAPENHIEALVTTAVSLYRPLSVALLIDGLAFSSLIFSDVQILQSLGILGVGWSIGLLVTLWLLLPWWSSLFRFRHVTTLQPLRMERVVSRLAQGLRSATSPSLLVPLGLLALAGFGIVAALQLRAGREIMGTTLFYSTHPYNQAFTLVNEKFIGVNQLIVVAQASDEVAFRSPQALRTIEAFQQYMAEDKDFGGTVAITNLIKSVTRMFHEDIPKWEVIPDDLNSAGQVVFRVISSAATPSEVARLFSQDFRATAVTFFYQHYSPSIVARILQRARTFMTTNTNPNVRFHIGGGLLGILAAIHAAVELSYWRFFVIFVVLVACSALFVTRSLRALIALLSSILLIQTALLLLLWWGGIDLNMYSLPVIIASLGMFVLPIFLLWIKQLDNSVAFHGLTTSGIITAVAATLWLLSPLRLQAEMGVFLIVTALLSILLPAQLQRLLDTTNVLTPTAAQRDRLPMSD